MSRDTTKPIERTTPERAAAADWTVADSAALYGMDRWSMGYFTVNEAGHVVVRPDPDSGPRIDLKSLVDGLSERDLAPPVLIRFTGILRHRLATLAGAFDRAIEEFGYRGRYRGVYPIKVNQQRHVVEEVLAFGKRYGFGLEAGSKPELLAVLALVDDPDTPIICNGFKDDEFIEAVILASKLGHNIIPVVEKASELRLIIRHAKAHDVRPRIGLRVKLAARGVGRWEQSAGERSKFGLFVSEVLDAVEYLRQQEMLDCLTLLHYHPGSQIHSVRAIKAGVNELARVFCELYRLGARPQYIDVGGGLGVAYDGTAAEHGAGINYTLREYANNVVFHVKEVCDACGVPHPTIVTESGRGISAYHSVLVFNVLGWSGFDRFEVPDDLSAEDLAALPKPVQTLYESYHRLDEHNFAEYFHDSLLNREEVIGAFNLGYCTLEQRGLAERLFYGICAKVLRRVRELPRVPEEFAGLEAMLADTYFCNFSLFQSLPDSWAIDQMFPIMPIHRLDERPTSRGTLADVTCDSDGRIDRFIGHGETRPVLELHPYTGGDYLIGVFLVGAYQEILGDLHNLFGDTNAVHVSVDDDGRVHIEEEVQGDTVSEVLSYVQFDVPQLRRSFQQTVERAVREQRLTLDEARQLRRFYERGLAGYTYLE